MGYSVHYSPQTDKKFPQKKKHNRKAGSIYVFLAVCIVTAALFRFVDPSLLRELLIPGEASVTLNAVETMVTQLKEGAPLTETVEAFCQEIVRHDLPA